MVEPLKTDLGSFQDVLIFILIIVAILAGVIFILGRYRR